VPLREEMPAARRLNAQVRAPAAPLPGRGPQRVPLGLVVRRPEVLDVQRPQWLRRTAIICQLGKRDRADVEPLTIAIESAIGDSDFFLRKVIGWALRDHAHRPGLGTIFRRHPPSEPAVTTRDWARM
jgi:DNA alkylation repair enzyme